MFFFLLAGLLSASFLYLAACYFDVGFYAWLIYLALMTFAILISIGEASSLFLPYYQFNQLLTYGTANWATPLYLQGANFAKEQNEELGKGEIVIGKLPRPLRRSFRFTLPQETALGSLVFFGPPRSGKSVLLMNYLRELANGGWSAVIIDPKGELYEYCAHYFNNVYRLDFSNPECSDRWNFVPLCEGNKEYAHMIASIMLGMEGTRYAGTDPFWQEAELALLTAILLYLPKVIDVPTPSHIHEFIALRSFEELCNELGNSNDHEIHVQWGTFTKAPEQTRGSVFTGLAAKINPFTIDAAKAISASITNDEYKKGARYINFERLRQQGTAIFVVIPEGAASRYKIPLATFVGQAVEHLRDDEINDATTPVMFVVDEAAHVPIVNLKEIPGVGRGRKFGVMLFYQNISQGFDMYGEHGFNAILGSINTKTFLPGCDLVTARYASELVGQTTVWGRAFDDALGVQYDKIRTTEAARPLMDPSEIRQLPVHKQAITIIETMPPVKWTYPESARTGPRAIPRKYGAPQVVSFKNAEIEKAKRFLRVSSTTANQLPAIRENTENQNRQSQTDSIVKRIIKEKTHEEIGHLLDMSDDPLLQFLV